MDLSSFYGERDVGFPAPSGLMYLLPGVLQKKKNDHVETTVPLQCSSQATNCPYDFLFQFSIFLSWEFPFCLKKRYFPLKCSSAGMIFSVKLLNKIYFPSIFSVFIVFVSIRGKEPLSLGKKIVWKVCWRNFINILAINKQYKISNCSLRRIPSPRKKKTDCENYNIYNLIWILQKVTWNSH